MPGYQQLKEGIVKTLRHDPSAVFHIEGSPGTAKTALTQDIARELNVPEERTFLLNPSRMEPTDLTGVPAVIGGTTHFNPTHLVRQLAEGNGPALVAFDDLAQAPMQVINPIASMVLDRRVDDIRIDRRVVFVSTGNRAKDKAGSKTLPTHYSNRVCTVGMDFSLDDWSMWAMAHGVPPEAVAFARLRPALMNDFDPSRSVNPTPRSWTHLWIKVPYDLPIAIYKPIAEGYVGEGPAADWVATKDIMSKMPNPDYCIMQPDGAEVPKEPAVLYAITTALSLRAQEDTFERSMRYVSRLPKEFSMLYVTDAIRLCPAVQQTKAFIAWALANKDTFMSSR